MLFINRLWPVEKIDKVFLLKQPYQALCAWHSFLLIYYLPLATEETRRSHCLRLQNKLAGPACSDATIQCCKRKTTGTVAEQLHLNCFCLSAMCWFIYETVATVPVSWVRWRAVFQSGSRVLKKVFWTFSHIYRWHKMWFMQKSCWKHSILKIA